MAIGALIKTVLFWSQPLRVPLRSEKAGHAEGLQEAVCAGVATRAAYPHSHRLFPL